MRLPEVLLLRSCTPFRWEGTEIGCCRGAIARRELSVRDALQLSTDNIPLCLFAKMEQQVVESRKEGAGLWLSQNPYVTVMMGKTMRKRPMIESCNRFAIPGSR